MTTALNIDDYIVKHCQNLTIKDTLGEIPDQSWKQPKPPWKKIYNYRNWGRISIGCWAHRRHAILRPHGRAMGVFCEYLWENLPRYNANALHVVITRSDISSQRVHITEPLWVWAIPLLTTTKNSHVHYVTANAVRTSAFSLTEHVRL